MRSVEIAIEQLRAAWLERQGLGHATLASGGGEGVEGEDAEGGRAVNDDEVETFGGEDGLQSEGDALGFLIFKFQI